MKMKLNLKFWKSHRTEDPLPLPVLLEPIAATPPNVRPLRIVCAALQFPDGLIICGTRHFDPIMRELIKRLEVLPQLAICGFVDQFGRFYTRAEAYKIAVNCGQIVFDATGKKELQSIDIY